MKHNRASVYQNWPMMENKCHLLSADRNLKTMLKDLLGWRINCFYELKMKDPVEKRKLKTVAGGFRSGTVFYSHTFLQSALLVLESGQLHISFCCRGRKKPWLVCISLNQSQSLVVLRPRCSYEAN